MKIQNIYSGYYSTGNFAPISKNFGSAKDMDLKNIAKNKLYLLPERMQKVVTEKIKKGEDNGVVLRDLHLDVYSKILECDSLSAVQNEYPEFGEVLQANVVIKHKSPNIKKIMEVMPLEDLSLFLIKERWANLKTTDEIAKELGLKDRSALNWVLDKIQIPRFERNYMTLLRSSDEEMNKIIAEKTRLYNISHRDVMLEHNRRVAQQSKDVQREISLRAWAMLPHVKKALSEMAQTCDKKVLMSEFWAKYPDYAKEYGEAKKIAAEELRNERKK